MRIVVCMKQVTDPEIPASSFTLDDTGRGLLPPRGVPPVLNPFDENALEAALRLKRSHDAEVIVISAGSRLAKAVGIKALAAGADTLLLLEDPELARADAFTTGNALADAIRAEGGADLILTGRQSADQDAGIVPHVLAASLHMPTITLAMSILLSDDVLQIERILDDGRETVETTLPCVVSVSNELGDLPPVTLPQIYKAKKKPVRKLRPLSPIMNAARREVLTLEIPQPTENCTMIEESTPDEAIDRLVSIIGDIRAKGEQG